jgi:outer membrane receptor protein involved in Fe transport
VVVTHYNQRVNDLVTGLDGVDSVRSLLPLPPENGHIPRSSVDSAGYGYMRQSQQVNIGSIRNQGWELQGTSTMGPIAVRGTYSFTKSRIIAPNPKYLSRLPGGSQWIEGAIMGGGATEHTWQVGATYAHAATSIGLTLNGIGQVYRYDIPDACGTRLMVGSNSRCYRADLENLRRGLNSNFLVPAYVIADINATRQFGSAIEGILQVRNANNKYSNDFGAKMAVMGRLTKVGLRVRL